MDARVIDNLEATEDLNLLPAVQTLPQCCCHLAQSLPEERRKKMEGWAGPKPQEKGVIFSEEQVAGAGSEEGGGGAVCVCKKHT